MVIFLVKKWVYFWLKNGYISGKKMIIFLIKKWAYFWVKKMVIFLVKK